MVKLSEFRSGFLVGGIFFSLSTLTGCPGVGDRMEFDESTQLSVKGKDVCFEVIDPQDYQPVDMAINPRGTPSINKIIIFNPALAVIKGELCVPPSFYDFPDKGQFIVEYTLTSKQKRDKSRKVVVVLGVADGKIYNMIPADNEISRPYGELSQ